MPSLFLPDLPVEDRALVMGVLNVTPDSFSDGGRWLDSAAAIAHGRQMISEGADIIDIGGESTRPGADPVPEPDQLDRVLPVIRELAADGVALSIDTMSARVAQRSVAAGVTVVNDVSGGLADPEMLRTVAELGVNYIAMHWRGHSRTMNQRAVYTDVVAEVVAELGDRLEAVADAGIDPERVAIDPGLGFAKDAEHNWAILRNLDHLTALGHPVLVGGSRKRFLGSLLAEHSGNFEETAAEPVPRPASERDDAGTALAALAARDGAWCIRSHRVRPTVDAVRVAARWVS